MRPEPLFALCHIINLPIRHIWEHLSDKTWLYSNEVAETMNREWIYRHCVIPIHLLDCVILWSGTTRIVDLYPTRLLLWLWISQELLRILLIDCRQIGGAAGDFEGTLLVVLVVLVVVLLPTDASRIAWRSMMVWPLDINTKNHLSLRSWSDFRARITLWLTRPRSTE